jgi:fructose-1,6-bisphosphatase/inositol monophosphatase family enzyme
MDLDDLDELITSVAAREVLPRFGRLAAADVQQKTSSFDVVTVADRAAEAAITAEVRARWPGTVVIGEESAGPADVLRAQLQADDALVLDPIDGTKNFASGLPLFAVMAAIMRRGQVVASVIHDPVTRSSARAAAGAGAWLRWPGEPDRRLRVADPVPVGQTEAIAGTRFVPEPVRSALAARLGQLAGHTWLRCGGHEYRLIAAGHVHALCYQRLMPWDHAPGWLLHREAGGHSAHFDGAPYDPGRMGGGLLCATDEGSWHALREALFGSEATR